MRSIRFRTESIPSSSTGGKRSLRKLLSRSGKFAGVSLALSVLVILPLLSLLIIPSVSAKPVGGNKPDPSPPVKNGGNKTATWVDHNHLTIDGVTYVDGQNDDNENFTSAGDNGNGCDNAYVDNFPAKGGNPDNANGPATLHTFAPVNPPTDLTCQETKYRISSFKNQTGFTDYFVWVDAGTIQTADGGSDMTFVKNKDGLYVDDGKGDANKSDKCLSTIEANPANPGKGTLIMRTGPNGDSPFHEGWAPQLTGADFHREGSCDVTKPLPVNLGSPDAAKKAEGTGGAGGGTTDGTDDSELGCEGTANPLSWIICPVINDLLVPAIDATDSLITQEMVLPANDIFCANAGGNNDTCDAYYTAWASFRNMALGLIAIAGLVIVIAQAVGMEILDAYTIRKMLPRILVAAIAITLSWPLMNFAVTLSNNLGFGIRDLIVAPFHNLDSTINLNFAGSGAGDFLGGLGLLGAGLVGGASIWIISGGLGIILSYVLTAGLAVLIAVLVLILRQIAIIMLILLSPIAIVAYVLPNTQRIFRLWWESFTRALLMFPLIAAFIAAGRVFAAISIASANNGPGGALQGLIGFVAYFAPYFMIPLTFRLSGSMMNGMGSFIQQRAQPALNGLGSYRSGKRKDRVARARSGGLYRGANRFSRAMNTVGDYTVNADENLPYDFGSGERLGRIGRIGGKANPIGYAGRKLFGRRSQELAEQIAMAKTDHTAKAAEKSRLHYSAAWAGLGMLDDKHGGQGLTAEGRTAIDKEFGTEFDESGNATAWRPIEKGDHAGIVKLGSMLQEYGADGSHAQMAGQQLQAKAGTLSSFGLDQETQRATPQSVFAFQAAKDGKLGTADIARLYNQSMDDTKPGTVERAVAEREMSQLEEVATQQRHDLRRAKGIRLDKNGRAYSVYSDKELTNADGTKTVAYKSDKAKESLMTAKANPAGMGKGEFWDDTKKSWLHFANEKGANGEYTTDAKELRKFIVQSEGIWGSGDPGAKAKVVDIKSQLGIDHSEEQGYQRGGVDPGDPKGGVDPGDLQAHAGLEAAATAAREAEAAAEAARNANPPG